MPEGPGAEELEVSVRVAVISMASIGPHVQVGLGAGSRGCVVGTAASVSGKKCAFSRLAFSALSLVRPPPAVLSGGKERCCHPLWVAAKRQTVPILDTLWSSW